MRYEPPTDPPPSQQQAQINRLLTLEPYLGLLIQQDGHYKDRLLYLLTLTTDKAKAEKVLEAQKKHRREESARVIEQALDRQQQKVNYQYSVNAQPVSGIVDDLEGELDLSNTALDDLSTLASQVSTIRSLNLKNTQVSDLSPLSDLTQLIHLNLTNTPVSDVSPLSGLTNLKFLSLSGTSVWDVSPLDKLTNLQELHLSRTRVTNVSPLAKLHQMKKLYLRGTPAENLNHLNFLVEQGLEVYR